MTFEEFSSAASQIATPIGRYSGAWSLSQVGADEMAGSIAGELFNFAATIEANSHEIVVKGRCEKQCLRNLSEACLLLTTVFDRGAKQAYDELTSGGAVT